MDTSGELSPHWNSIIHTYVGEIFEKGLKFPRCEFYYPTLPNRLTESKSKGRWVLDWILLLFSTKHPMNLVNRGGRRELNQVLSIERQWEGISQVFMWYIYYFIMIHVCFSQIWSMPDVGAPLTFHWDYLKILNYEIYYMYFIWFLVKHKSTKALRHGIGYCLI